MCVATHSCVCLCCYKIKMLVCICVLLKMIKLMIWSKMFIAAEGAFKKLKPEPNSGLSSLSGGVSSPGSGISSLPQHAGHTPTTASCPTPARRRHRTTFTQVFIHSWPFYSISHSKKEKKNSAYTFMQIYRNCSFILKLDNYSVMRLES